MSEKNIIVVTHKNRIRCLLKNLIPEFMNNVNKINTLIDQKDSYEFCLFNQNKDTKTYINDGAIFLFEIENINDTNNDNSTMKISLKYSGKKNTKLNHFIQLENNPNDPNDPNGVKKKIYKNISETKKEEINKKYTGLKDYKDESFCKDNIFFKHEDNYNAFTFPNMIINDFYNYYDKKFPSDFEKIYKYKSNSKVNIYMIVDCDSTSISSQEGNGLLDKLKNVSNKSTSTKKSENTDPVRSDACNDQIVETSKKLKEIIINSKLNKNKNIDYLFSSRAKRTREMIDIIIKNMNNQSEASDVSEQSRVSDVSRVSDGSDVSDIISFPMYITVLPCSHDLTINSVNKELYCDDHIFEKNKPNIISCSGNDEDKNAPIYCNTLQDSKIKINWNVYNEFYTTKKGKLNPTRKYNCSVFNMISLILKEIHTSSYIKSEEQEIKSEEFISDLEKNETKKNTSETQEKNPKNNIKNVIDAILVEIQQKKINLESVYKLSIKNNNIEELTISISKFLEYLYDLKKNTIYDNNYENGVNEENKEILREIDKFQSEIMRLYNNIYNLSTLENKENRNKASENYLNIRKALDNIMVKLKNIRKQLNGGYYNKYLKMKNKIIY